MDQLWGQISITQGGAAAILAVLVLLILLGRLVPLRYLDALRKDKNEQLTEVRSERDNWRAAAEREATARMAAQEQLGELMELARTAGHVLGALPQPARQEVTAGAPVDQAPAPPP